MQRHDMIEAMRGPGLKGMAGEFDGPLTTGLQRQRTTMEILTHLLRKETTHRHAASIQYPMTAARLPVVKDIDAFRFEGTRSTKGWCVHCTAARSYPPGAISFWSAEQALEDPSGHRHHR